MKKNPCLLTFFLVFWPKAMLNLALFDELLTLKKRFFLHFSFCKINMLSFHVGEVYVCT